jgi:hypothetical protein
MNTVVTREIQITDDQGNPRIVLSVRSGNPAIELLQANGSSSASIALDAAGRPSLKLHSPAPGGLMAAIEIDEKGAHIKFDRAGGGSSYLFLNNAGGSGLVLIDAHGTRRLEALVSADGVSRTAGFGPEVKSA